MRRRGGVGGGKRGGVGGVGLGGAGGDNIGHQVGKVVGWGEPGDAAAGGCGMRRIMGGVQNIFSWACILKSSYPSWLSVGC